MITIDQLLESVDLDFEPRFVTKDATGEIWMWNTRPDKCAKWCLKRDTPNSLYGRFIADRIKLSEFDGKDWTECIYEVPRKVNYGKLVGKLCRFYDNTTDRRTYGLLAYRANGVFAVCGINSTFDYCEPVRPDDDVIYKGE